MAYAATKEEGCDANGTQIPLLWSELIETGLAEVQQTLGAVISKRWLHVDHSGIPTLVEVDKHRVVQELGIRYRDLLILDPSIPTPSPSTLLIRERAMVVNLEAVRMIITANQVFLLSVPKASDPRVAAFPTLDNPFVRQLCKCLRSRSSASLHDLNRSSLFDFDAPYELRALEVGLATATNLQDREVYELERAAFPAIDRLANNVSRGVLEEVRQVKQQLGKLMARVERLKQELEEILEDDMDMADMYLGRRALLGGEAPPDPLGLAVGHSQSAQSVLEAAPAMRRAHASEADVAGRAHSPASRQAVPHAPSASSLASHPSPSASAAHLDASTRHAWPEGGAAGTHARHGGALGGRGAGHGGDADMHSPAPDHLGHLSTRADAGRGEGSRHGSAAAQQRWHRASTVVRTVRTVKKKKKGPAQSNAAATQDAAAAAAAALAAGAAGGQLEGEPLLEKAGSAPPAMESTAGEDEEGDDSDEVIETIFEQPSVPAVDPHDIQDAEDLLESYFIQVDHILRRLLAVNERIDDVEDLVAIELDHRRNELVAMDLLVTIVSCGLAFCAAVAGVFGMNLMPFSQTKGFFWGLIAVMTLAAGAVVGGCIWWVRHRRLLFVPQL